MATRSPARTPRATSVPAARRPARLHLGPGEADLLLAQPHEGDAGGVAGRRREHLGHGRVARDRRGRAPEPGHGATSSRGAGGDDARQVGERAGRGGVLVGEQDAEPVLDRHHEREERQRVEAGGQLLVVAELGPRVQLLPDDAPDLGGDLLLARRSPAAGHGTNLPFPSKARPTPGRAPAPRRGCGTHRMRGVPQGEQRGPGATCPRRAAGRPSPRSPPGSWGGAGSGRGRR